MPVLPRLDEVLDTLRRRVGLVLSVMCLGFVLSAALGLAQHPLFEAREVIRLEAPRLNETAVMAAERGRLSLQLPALIREVLSPEQLVSVALAYDLYSDQPELSPDGRARALRRAIEVEPQAPDGGGEPDRVVISVRLGDPERARMVAEELGHRLIRESVLLRIAEAQATLDFLTARELALAADLADQDRRLENFRAQHDAALAGADPALVEALARTEAAILATDRARVGLDAERAALVTGAAPGQESRLAREAEALDRRRIALAAEQRAQLRALAPPANLEQDYAALLRGMEGLLARLDAAAGQRNAAEVALLLETRRMSERLTVAEPAVRPAEPLSDRRTAIAFGGGAFSALLAIVLALLLDWRRPVVRTVAHLRRLTDADVIVAVPRASQARRRSSGG